jgi:hypothetical protein
MVRTTCFRVLMGRNLDRFWFASVRRRFVVWGFGYQLTESQHGIRGQPRSGSICVHQRCYCGCSLRVSAIRA